MKRIVIAALAGSVLSLPVFGGDAHHLGGKFTATVAQASATLAEGEVRKVDRDAKKLTIRHGPLKNLDMPAMTMVFQVQDAAMLEQVKAGDKVRFEAQKIGGAYTVVRIESAQ
jgi:Cu(I)/Ag(I) efflux system periplasmic protein CusF